MKAIDSQEFIEELSKDGYAASVATNEELRIVKTYVDADDIENALIVVMPYGYPMIVGGIFDNHRLVHHSVHVDEGQRLIGKFSRPE